MKTHLFLIISLLMLTASLHAQDNTASVQLAAAIYEEEVTGNLDKAVELYQNILKEYPDDRPVAAKALYHLGLVNEKMGKEKATEYFSRLISTYPDQTEVVNLAKAKLAALNTGTAARSDEVALHRIWDAGSNMPVCISPDGQYVVFYGSDNMGNLWLRNLRSGEQKQITREGSWVDYMFSSNSAAISPDGKWIAYSWQAKSYGELRISLLDGSSMHILHNGQDGRTMYVIAWMPDGRHILTVSENLNDQAYQRHIISLQDGSVCDFGKSQQEFESFGGVCSSPDGRYISYNMNGDILIYDTATKRDSVLFQTPAADKMVGWTPDGSGIIFVSDRSGTRDLYLLGIRNDGRPLGEPQLLRREIGDASDLYLARDGRLFQTERKGMFDSFIVQVDEKTGKPTGTPSLVDPSYPGVNCAAWSSDGKLLYYMNNRGPYGNRSIVLVIRSEETGKKREIIPKQLPWWSGPVLSPDGRRFVVNGEDENKNVGLFIIDSESGDVSPLVKIPTENEMVNPDANWSPDGKAIFYKVRSPEEREGFIVRRKDLTTGEEKDVHRGFITRDMDISPDGTRFVYIRGDGQAKSYVLGIMDIQSGKELELWHIPEADAPGGIMSPRWTPDGKYVLLITFGSKNDCALWRFSATGGPGEKLCLFPRATWRLEMHPGGDRMAITQDVASWELWVMENFLAKE